MKRSKNFFKLEQDGNKVLWKKIPIKALGENRFSINEKEYDIKPNIQNYFTNTRQTTQHMDNDDKSTVYDILKDIGFYSMRHKRGKKSFRMKDCFIQSTESNR